MLDLSVVIPTYNERDNISILIGRLIDLLTPLCTFEILVVDDDSPDRTWKLVDGLSQQDGRIVCLRRKVDKGLSQSVFDGFSRSRGNYLAVIDADLQHDEDLLEKMLLKIPQYKVVIGSRKTEGGGVKNWNYFRRFFKLGSTQMAHFVIKSRVKDPMSGFFMLQKEAFDAIREKINPRGFKILLEIIYHFESKDVVELGYIFRPRERGESKLSGTVMLEYLIGLYKLRFSNLLPLDFIQYCLVGLSGVGVNLGTLWLTTSIGWSDDAALSSAIFLSMVSNYILNNFWTFKKERRKGWKFMVGFFLYLATCAAGALINYAVAMLLKQKLGLYLALGDLVGILLATIWNYTLGKKWVWKGVYRISH